MERLTFIIQRYNPETDEKPYDKSYELDVPEGYTILDCLNDIKWQQDGTLTYNRSCRHAICGICAIRVNGRAKLACKTQVQDILDEFKSKTIKIGPLGNMKIIKDLVVDRENFWGALDKTKPYVVTEFPEHPTSETLQTKEQFKNFRDEDHCIMCGACYSDCPSVAGTGQEYWGPAALAKAFRFAVDPRDTITQERMEDLNTQHGVWECMRCYDCWQRCPKDVKPVDLIIRLRNKSFDHLNKNSNTGMRHAVSFQESTNSTGILDETHVTLRSVGLMGAIAHLPLALAFAKRGKAPSSKFMMKPSKNMDEVRKIYEAVEKNNENK